MVDLTYINVSQNYDEYKRSMDAFNASLHSIISDIYNRILTLTDSVSSINKIIQDYGSGFSKLSADAGRFDSQLKQVSQEISTLSSGVNNLSKSTSDAISNLSSTIGGVDAKLTKFSDTTLRSIQPINELMERVNMLKDGYKSITAVSSGFNDLAKNVNVAVSNQNSAINELNSRVTKLSDTVVNSMPSLNGVIEDIDGLKKDISSVKDEVKTVVDSVNSLNVQTNGFQLKLGSISSEFANIERNIGDLHKTSLDFINTSKGMMSAFSSTDLESISTSVKMLADKLESIVNQVNKLSDDDLSVKKEVSGISSKLSDLNAIKNLNKILEEAINTAKAINESENRINGISSKAELMFNRVTESLDKFTQFDDRLNDLSRKMFELGKEIDRMKTTLPMFATKDDILTLNKKINENIKTS